MDGPVGALAVSGSDLYVAGAFTTAGGSNANHVAKWNGSAWLALGSGLGEVIQRVCMKLEECRRNRAGADSTGQRPTDFLPSAA